MFRGHKPLFDRNLEKERNNVTLPGEQVLADRLSERFARYLTRSEDYYRLPRDARRFAPV